MGIACRATWADPHPRGEVSSCPVGTGPRRIGWACGPGWREVVAATSQAGWCYFFDSH
jgi:hypothetical protein